MTISILGGRAKGLPLFIPAADLIRPTSVRLKRRLFDSWQDWSGFQVFDLCAGSGAIGLEAWSRGAERVYLVEGSKKVASFTQKNVDGLKQRFSQEVQDRPIEIVLKDLSKAFKDISFNKSSDDIVIFFDPPYENHKLYEKVINELIKANIESYLWIESDRQKGLSMERLEGLLGPCQKSFTQGSSFMGLWSLKKLSF